VSALVLSPPLPGIGDRILGPQAVREFWFHAAVTAAGMRSLKHLLALADELCERGVGLVVLKQHIDTTTPAGRLVFHILGAIDKFHGLEGRSVQPLALAMILAGPPVISV
jgi:Resolvase, N terminal domain